MDNFITNEVVIELTIDDVKFAIDKLIDNEHYINLNKNIFSIDNIKTCFKIEEIKADKFENLNECFFRFSYNDGNISQVFKVVCKYNDTTSYGFLKTSNFMDLDQLYSLVQKVYNMIDKIKEYNLHSLSNDLYNEALIFVTNGINKEECKSIKDDFESKYEVYLKKQNEKNDQIKEEMNKLYNLLIEIKTY
jgi:hypothetical protein